MNVSPFKSVSYMFEKDLYEDGFVDALDEFFEQRPSESSATKSPRQGSRPDACRRAAIVARKIERARQLMAAFGRPMKF